MASSTAIILVDDETQLADLNKLKSSFDDDLLKDGARALQSLPVIKMDKDSNQIKIVNGEDQLFTDKELFVAPIGVFDFNILFIKGKDDKGEDIDVRACTTDLTLVSEKNKVGAFRINESTRGFAPFNATEYDDGSVLHKECSQCPWSRSGTKKDIGGEGEGRACQSRKLYLLAVCVPSVNANGLQLYMPTMLAVMNVSMSSAWGFPGEMSKSLLNCKRSIVTDIPTHACVVKLTTELKGEGKVKYRIPHATSAGFIQYKKAEDKLREFMQIRSDVQTENTLAEQVIKTAGEGNKPMTDIPF